MAFSVPGLKALKQNERGVIFRLGRFSRVAEPGLVPYYPILDRIILVNLDRTVLDGEVYQRKI